MMVMEESLEQIGEMLSSIAVSLRVLASAEIGKRKGSISGVPGEFFSNNLMDVFNRTEPVLNDEK